MKKTKDLRKEKMREGLAKLWPDIPVNRMTCTWVGDFNIYDTIQLKIVDDFTGEMKFFPVSMVSPYLRGNLIRTYYARGLTPIKELLGGM